MNRRDFMQAAVSAAAVGAFPHSSLAAMRSNHNARIVVFVELKGGNDGFNTLIPYDDDEYHHLRSSLAIKPQRAVKLKDGFAMHHSLAPLKGIWDSGDLAWIQGVGYPDGILSHFRSMDVWDSGVTGYNSTVGWLTKVLPRYKQGLHGIAITPDQGALGPLAGSAINSVSMQNPRTFLSQARLVKDVGVSRATPALAHITRTQQQLVNVGKQIVDKMGTHPPRLPVPFSRGALGHGLESVAQMIVSGIDCPVYKVTQDGFDTHIGQASPHANSLYHVGHGLASFAKMMKKANMWDNVLVVTYSEFGRRIVENKGRGTDHGTASVQMVLGGRVRGGIYGEHPDLRNLDENKNVQYTTDFRSVYGTLAQHWWRQPSPYRGHRLLPFIA